VELTWYNTFQALGCIAAVLGSWLVASPDRLQRWAGFFLYLISNGCLIVWAVAAAQYPLLLLYLIFIPSSLRGMNSNGGDR
jgi:hypothetical protein